MRGAGGVVLDDDALEPREGGVVVEREAVEAVARELRVGELEARRLHAVDADVDRAVAADVFADTGRVDLREGDLVLRVVAPEAETAPRAGDLLEPGEADLLVRRALGDERGARFDLQ